MKILGFVINGVVRSNGSLGTFNQICVFLCKSCFDLILLGEGRTISCNGAMALGTTV